MLKKKNVLKAESDHGTVRKSSTFCELQKMAGSRELREMVWAEERLGKNPDIGNLHLYKAFRVLPQTVFFRGIALNLTQLARTMGVSIALLSRIFTEDLNGSVATIENLARTLGFSVDDTLQEIRVWRERRPALQEWRQA